MLDSHTQRKVAAEWINGRTDKPYAVAHVNYVAQIWRRFGGVHLSERPSWADAYQTVKERSDEIVDTGQRWKEMVEARPPTSAESAERFVRNLVDRGLPEVRAQIATGLLSDPETRDDVVRTSQGLAAIQAAGRVARSDGMAHVGTHEPLPEVPAFMSLFWRAVTAVRVAHETLDVQGLGDVIEPEANEAADRLRRQAGEIAAAISEAIVERSLH